MIENQRVLLLRTCHANGTAYNGFQWKTQVGAEISAPDWDPTPECGKGLHGLLWGEGDGTLLNWSTDALWMVISALRKDIVDLNGKVKFPSARIEHVGTQESATKFLHENGGEVRAITGITLTGGDGSKLTGGRYSTLTGGRYSTLTGGDNSTLTGGRYSTLTGGDNSTLDGGNDSTLTGGISSKLTGGNDSKLTGGNYSKLNGGDGSKLTGGNCSKLNGGDYSTLTGGNGSMLTGGVGSKLTGGYNSTLTGGNYSKLTGGNYSTLTGGEGSMLSIDWWDEKRIRRIIGYVGEDGIEPNVAYIVKNGKLIREDGK